MNMQILRKNEMSIDDLKEKYYRNDKMWWNESNDGSVLYPVII